MKLTHELITQNEKQGQLIFFSSAFPPTFSIIQLLAEIFPNGFLEHNETILFCKTVKKTKTKGNL